MRFSIARLHGLLLVCLGVFFFGRIERVTRTFSYLLLCSLVFASVTKAQVTSPATINAGNQIGANNIGGTASNTQNFGSLAGLGLNQGESFTFTDAVYGLQFFMGGLDNADDTTITFFRNNVPVPVTVSTYVNGGITVPRRGAGTHKC